MQELLLHLGTRSTHVFTHTHRRMPSICVYIFLWYRASHVLVESSTTKLHPQALLDFSQEITIAGP